MRSMTTVVRTPKVSARLGKSVAGTPHIIGAGFNAKHFSAQMFGGRMDPLLMVDHFVMTAPTFEPHLHAGISAVTAMFEDSQGAFLNRDTLGHNIALKAGDLYWLTAASGAAHEETPAEGARIHALQIFVNLPKHLKSEPPRSLRVSAEDVPVLEGQGYRVRIVLGRSGISIGAADTPEEMTLLDGFLQQSGRFSHRLPSGRAAWIYAVAGRVTISVDEEKRTLETGRATTVQAGAEIDIVLEPGEPSHFVLMAARPLGKPLI